MALEGDLSEFHLTDLIQLVDLSKKTGGVFLQGKRGQETLEGWIYFRDGKIVGAKLGSMPQLDAVYAFFTLSSGFFRFNDDIAIANPQISRSNEMIIMEGIMFQESWQEKQSQLPPPGMVPRLVTNPSSGGNEINIEPDEWRVLTMINGKNTVSHIAQRSGLGEQRTGEIVTQLLKNGLIERHEPNLSETLYPVIDQLIVQSLGTTARTLLEDAYTKAGIRDRTAATQEQVLQATQYFETSANRMFGPARVRPITGEVRTHIEEVFGALA